MELTQVKSKVRELNEFGQSVWLDNISRTMIDNGELNNLISLGVTGVTSNPTIFEKAVSGNADYARNIGELKLKGLSTFDIYDTLTVCDICDAADLFRNVFKETKASDGYVSLEVNPLLANDAQGTIEEAKRLYKKVNRPNVLFKIPATKNGLAAAKELLKEGININFTLIFSVEQYVQTAQIFIEAAEEFHKLGGDLKNIFSVASVFVSRIDTVVDKLIDGCLGSDSLKGKAAVVNSKIIFDEYQKIFSTPEFLKLNKNGLKKQRLLWASTSTKNPNYSDIKYVTELIGEETINTLPQSTLEAFFDHGVITNSLELMRDTHKIIESLESFNIDINKVCAELLLDGVRAFQGSFDSLLKTIEIK